MPNVRLITRIGNSFQRGCHGKRENNTLGKHEMTVTRVSFSLVSYICRAVQAENQLVAKHMVSGMKLENDTVVGPGKYGVLTSELLNVLLLSVHRYSTAY